MEDERAIRALSKGTFTRSDFPRLLPLATDADEDKLRRIVLDELLKLSVLGIVEEGEVVAFVAFDVDMGPRGHRVHRDAPGMQGGGTAESSWRRRARPRWAVRSTRRPTMTRSASTVVSASA